MEKVVKDSSVSKCFLLKPYSVSLHHSSACPFMVFKVFIVPKIMPQSFLQRVFDNKILVFVYPIKYLYFTKIVEGGQPSCKNMHE